MSDNPEIRYADMGGGRIDFDEFLAKGCDIHFEAMADSEWWMSVAVGDRMWHLNWGAKNPRAAGYAICEEITTHTTHPGAAPGRADNAEGDDRE